MHAWADAFLVECIDPETGEPSADLRDTIIQTAFEHGLLLLGCGEFGIRFCPPLCITERQIEIALGLLDRVLAECGQKVGASER